MTHASEDVPDEALVSPRSEETVPSSWNPWDRYKVLIDYGSAQHVKNERRPLQPCHNTVVPSGLKVLQCTEADLREIQIPRSPYQLDETKHTDEWFTYFSNVCGHLS